MRKIILTEWISLDGFVCGPNNDMGFVGQFFDETMGQYESNFLDSGDTVMLGRVTYDSFAGAWPDRETDPKLAEGERDYAKRLNAKKKIVFSRKMEKAEWNNSEVWKEIDPEKIQALKNSEGGDILIYGSASIVQQLTNLGLIDGYQLLMHPIVLGDGKPLFKDIKEKKTLKLIESKPFPSGVVLLKYSSSMD